MNLSPMVFQGVLACGGMNFCGSERGGNKTATNRENLMTVLGMENTRWIKKHLRQAKTVTTPIRVVSTGCWKAGTAGQERGRPVVHTGTNGRN